MLTYRIYYDSINAAHVLWGMRASQPGITSSYVNQVTALPPESFSPGRPISNFIAPSPAALVVTALSSGLDFLDTNPLRNVKFSPLSRISSHSISLNPTNQVMIGVSGNSIAVPITWMQLHTVGASFPANSLSGK